MERLSDHQTRSLVTSAQTFDFDEGEAAVRRRPAGIDPERFPKIIENPFSAPDRAGQVGTDLKEGAAGRAAAEHRIERHGFPHLDRPEDEKVGDLGFLLGSDESVFVLNEMEGGKKGRFFVRIPA
jgi:hypothetical protein